MKRRFALLVLTLLVVGLVSAALALQNIKCPRCGSTDTYAVYECTSCGAPFGVAPAQSTNGLVPPAKWKCPECGCDSVPPTCAGCSNPICMLVFWHA